MDAPTLQEACRACIAALDEATAWHEMNAYRTQVVCAKDTAIGRAMLDQMSTAMSMAQTALKNEPAEDKTSEKVIEVLLQVLRSAGAPVSDDGDIEPLVEWAQEQAKRRVAPATVILYRDQQP